MIIRPRTSSRAARSARTLAATLAGAALLIGTLAACWPDEPVVTPSATATASPTASATPSETPTAAPTPTSEPEPADVALTAQGVGPVLVGTSDALPALEALFGTADSTDGTLAACGAPAITFATWGDLWVSLESGTLYGWQLSGADLPAVATLPYDTIIGVPYGVVTGLPGVGPDEFLDNYQVHTLAVDGVTFWFEADTADSPATMIGSAILGCG